MPVAVQQLGHDYGETYTSPFDLREFVSPHSDVPKQKRGYTSYEQAFYEPSSHLSVSFVHPFFNGLFHDFFLVLFRHETILWSMPHRRLSSLIVAMLFAVLMSFRLRAQKKPDKKIPKKLGHQAIDMNITVLNRQANSSPVSVMFPDVEAIATLSPFDIPFYGISTCIKTSPNRCLQANGETSSQRGLDNSEGDFSVLFVFDANRSVLWVDRDIEHHSEDVLAEDVTVILRAGG